MANTTLTAALTVARDSGEFAQRRPQELRRNEGTLFPGKKSEGVAGRIASGPGNTATIPIESKKSSRWKWIGSLFVVGVSASAVYQPWRDSRPQTHGPELSAVVRKSVEIQRPSPSGTASVVLPATVRPWQAASISARVNGYLAHWRHDLGDEIQAGELLAEIETPELDQELAAAEALAREADAATLQAVAELSEAQADLKSTEAQLVRVRAELELTKSQLSRREKLVANRVITQEEFDSFSREVEAREATVAAAQSDVSRRHTNLQTRKAIIDAREATAKSRQSSVDRLKELQGFKRIVAPFDGVVTRRTAEKGILVTAGRDVLFVMEDMSRVRVQINVPQSYSSQIQPGVGATVTIPDSLMTAVPGVITRVSSSVDSESRTMLAEIELENDSRQFQPGSYGQVTLKTQQATSSWTIPTNTILMRITGPHVAVVSPEDQIELRQVSLGRDLGNRVLVTDGIHGQERLVVNPGNDLANGLPVRVSQRAAAVDLARK